MSRITRESFVATVAAEGARLDVNALGSRTEETLQRAGIARSALAEIAGENGTISGDEELSKLFDLLDSVDRDGGFDSISTTKRGTDGRQVDTASGALWSVLHNEMESARLSRGSGVGRAGVTLTSTIESEGAPRNLSGANDTTPTDAEPGLLPGRDFRAGPIEHSRAITTLEAQGFTEIHLAKNTPYFNQAHKAWANHPYPKSPPTLGQSRTLAQSGCAPAALAIADAALRGSGTTPIHVADFAVQGGFSGTVGRSGSDAHGMGQAWAAAHGLTYTAATSKDQSKNIDTLRDGINSGGVGVIGVGVDPSNGRGHFTAKGHVMVVNGYAKDGHGNEWFFIVDPGRNNQGRSPHLGPDQSLVQDKALHLGAGQLRISREQIQAELRHGFVLTKNPQ